MFLYSGNLPLLYSGNPKMAQWKSTGEVFFVS